jgi:hypothetical protein
VIRRGLAAAVLSLLVAAAAGGAVIGGGLSISVGNGGADGEVGQGFDNVLGTGWDPIATCRAGNNFFTEYRFALEFPLDALPDGATITGATLEIRAATGPASGQTTVLGYAGNGALTADDVQVTGASVVITPASDLRESYDVSALMSPQMVAAGWAGFAFRHAPLVGTIGTWDCPDAADFPILTVEYTLAGPATPSPSPTPTPTPAGTTDPSPTSGEVLLPDTQADVGGPDPVGPAALVAIAAVAVLLGRGAWSRSRISR